MKRTLRIAAILLAFCLVLVAVGCSSPTPPASSGGATPPATSGGTAKVTTVTIKGFAFEPASVTIKAGESVTFQNDDSVAHTVTAAAFQSGEIAPGASYTQKIDQPGTYDYTCSIHPQMKGTIVVQ